MIIEEQTFGSTLMSVTIQQFLCVFLDWLQVFGLL
jgi:hypothetical protein